uniref:Uncharacterized protein n=1 Tax=Chrysotila carterae TaxID=13221 RepID=A0A7S4BA68_CHRCT
MLSQVAAASEGHAALGRFATEPAVRTVCSSAWVVQLSLACGCSLETALKAHRGTLAVEHNATRTRAALGPEAFWTELVKKRFSLLRSAAQLDPVLSSFHPTLHSDFLPPSAALARYGCIPSTHVPLSVCFKLVQQQDLATRR